MKTYSIFSELNGTQRIIPRNEALVRAREQLGVLQRDIAEATGVSEAYISHAETLRLYPPRSIQEKICRFFTENGIPAKTEELFPEYLRLFIRDPYERKTHRKVEEVPIGEGLAIDAGKFVLYESPENHILKDEFEAVVRQVLQTLPRKERQVIYMLYYEEKSRREVAKTLGVTPQWVHGLHWKAVRKLQHRTRARRLEPYLQ